MLNRMSPTVFSMLLDEAAVVKDPETLQIIACDHMSSPPLPPPLLLLLSGTTLTLIEPLKLNTPAFSMIPLSPADADVPAADPTSLVRISYSHPNTAAESGGVFI